MSAQHDDEQAASEAPVQGAPSPAAEPAPAPLTARAERLAEVRRRMALGLYDTPAVAEATAWRLADLGLV